MTLPRTGRLTPPNRAVEATELPATLARVRRRVLLGFLVGIPLIGVVAALAWSMRSATLPDPLPAPKTPALPDLAMSPLTDIAVSEAVGSDARYVSFTAAPANVGRGALIIHA